MAISTEVFRGKLQPDTALNSLSNLSGLLNSLVKTVAINSIASAVETVTYGVINHTLKKGGINLNFASDFSQFGVQMGSKYFTVWK